MPILNSRLTATGTKVASIIVVLGCALALGFARTGRAAKDKPTTEEGRASGVPAFKFDATWPKLPLPNKWTFEGVTGLTVDKDGIIWVLHRPADFDVDPIFHTPNKTENYAALDPPTAMCCVKPPAVLAFDQQGNLVRSWDVAEGPSGHLILADKAGNIWIGSNTLRKYTKEGKLLAELPRVPEPRPKAGDYPGATPEIVGNIEGGDIDENAHEIYLTDSYLRGRVLVYDLDTLKFKRGWGAYGKPLAEISTQAPEKYNPANPPAKDFLGHVTLGLTSDGLLYAADRIDDRIQVFTEQGKFVKEFKVAPETLDRGSTGGLAFSPPPEQRYMYVSDIMNNVVWIVNRKEGQVVGHFGFAGHNGGGFHWIHMVATDARGNVYTGEVDSGKRVQRFLVQR